MLLLNTKNIIKCALTLMVVCSVISASYSSSFNSGKTKKRASSKSSLVLNLHNRSLNLSLSNGYSFKGSFKNLKNSRSGISIDIQSVYFQKGNNLYVIPVKQKAFLNNKFKTPQKSY
jgi:hypothetical protein